MTAILPADKMPPTQEVCFDCGEADCQAVQKCMEDMWNCVMLNQPLMVGLAANQLAYPYRIIIIPTQEMSPNKKGGRSRFAGFRTIINPSIDNSITNLGRDNEETDFESCFSVGLDKLYKVRRKWSVVVNGYQPNGEAVKIALSGFPARVAQHEIDHLDSISIVDRNYELTKAKEHPLWPNPKVITKTLTPGRFR